MSTAPCPILNYCLACKRGLPIVQRVELHERITVVANSLPGALPDTSNTRYLKEPEVKTEDVGEKARQEIGIPRHINKRKRAPDTETPPTPSLGDLMVLDQDDEDDENDEEQQTRASKKMARLLEQKLNSGSSNGGKASSNDKAMQPATKASSASGKEQPAAEKTDKSAVRADSPTNKILSTTNQALKVIEKALAHSGKAITAADARNEVAALKMHMESKSSNTPPTAKSTNTQGVGSQRLLPAGYMAHRAKKGPKGDTLVISKDSTKVKKLQQSSLTASGSLKPKYGDVYRLTKTWENHDRIEKGYVEKGEVVTFIRYVTEKMWCCRCKGSEFECINCDYLERA